MSTVNEGVRAYLVAQSAITALCSTRVRTTQADQSDDLPYILLTTVSDMSVYAMAGEAGLARARQQVDVIARTPLAAIALSEAVRAAMSGYRGAMGTLPVRRCHRIDRSGPDLFGPDDGGQRGKYRVRMDFAIDYHEST